MQSALLGLATLACPVGMGLMMWMMMRGQRHGDRNTAASSGSSVVDHASQVEALRAEIERLKADRAARTVSGGR